MGGKQLRDECQVLNRTFLFGQADETNLLGRCHDESCAVGIE